MSYSRVEFGRAGGVLLIRASAFVRSVGLALTFLSGASLIRPLFLYCSYVLSEFFAPRAGLPLALVGGASLIRPLFFYCSYVVSELFAPRARGLACFALPMDLFVQPNYVACTQ